MFLSHHCIATVLSYSSIAALYSFFYISFDMLKSYWSYSFVQSKDAAKIISMGS